MGTTIARTGSAALMVMLLLACGGASKSDLFAGGGTDSPNVDGGAGADASVSSDGGTTADARPNDGSVSDVSVVDTGVDAAPQDGIRCGATFCTPGTQVCCRGAGVNPTFSCVNPAGCQGISQLPIPCDDANDCTAMGRPGDVCCVTVDFSSRAASLACTSAGKCDGNEFVIACNPADADPCPNGGTCSKSSGTLPGYMLCL